MLTARLDARADLSLPDDPDRHPPEHRGLVPAQKSRASSPFRCRLSIAIGVSLLWPVGGGGASLRSSSSGSCIWVLSSGAIVRGARVRRCTYEAKLLLLAVVVVAVWRDACVAWLARFRPLAPNTYEETTRAFYHGLAALEVGLLDDARQQFTSATMLVPREPASWANLGLVATAARELEAAAEPVERALSLAPDNSDLVLLAARMETARARLDEGARAFRLVRWLLDAQGLRTRFALAEELHTVRECRRPTRKRRRCSTSSPRGHRQHRHSIGARAARGQS